MDVTDGQSLTLDELVSAARLKSVGFRELTCRHGSDTSRPTQREPTFRLEIRFDEEHPDVFDLALRIDIDFEDESAITVQAVARYGLADGTRPSPTRELILEFANEVGVMVLLPYIRQAVGNLTLQVFGSSLLMPVIERGKLRFSSEGSS